MFPTLILIGIVLAGTLIVISLMQLGMAVMDDVSRALWALIILAIPVLGSVVFFIVSPGERGQRRG